MWKARSRDNGPIHRRSLSSANFTHTSFKDVEHLFSNDNDINSFRNLSDQPPPMTPPMTSSTVTRRLSVFHRVHLANKFARAFAKPVPDSRAAVDEKLMKGETQISEKSRAAVDERRMTVTGAEFSKLSIDSKSTKRVERVDSRAAAEEKSTKSERRMTVTGTEFDSKSTKRVERAETKPAKPNRLMTTIPGAEKRVVLYTTSLRVVRSTFEACKTVNSILRAFRVSIDERDLSMDSNYLSELQSIMTENNEECEKTNLTLPKVFIGGRYIGGAEEVKMLHESGELKKYIEELPAVRNGVCELCGDFRFVLCDECRGSHKCYSEKSGFRSCSLCNENGLIRCLACFDS
ncbi:Glutaredoxin [Artemisia annua]|uniref:Glutaredoxin n=1 Tax=Artemisia annua TaxID=35608 RepID=A0A2U1MBY4_ARTAN|nr:Glutaredoxin [Artemisia annua]